MSNTYKTTGFYRRQQVNIELYVNDNYVKDGNGRGTFCHNSSKNATRVLVVPDVVYNTINLTSNIVALNIFVRTMTVNFNDPLTTKRTIILQVLERKKLQLV